MLFLFIFLHLLCFLRTGTLIRVRIPNKDPDPEGKWIRIQQENQDIFSKSFIKLIHSFIHFPTIYFDFLQVPYLQFYKHFIYCCSYKTTCYVKYLGIFFSAGTKTDIWN